MRWSVELFNGIWNIHWRYLLHQHQLIGHCQHELACSLILLFVCHLQLSYQTIGILLVHFNFDPDLVSVKWSLHCCQKNTVFSCSFTSYHLNLSWPSTYCIFFIRCGLSLFLQLVTFIHKSIFMRASRCWYIVKVIFWRGSAVIAKWSYREWLMPRFEHWLMCLLSLK